jgi:hypothetical protein
MKKYYEKRIAYVSEKHKQCLMAGLDASQRGNESQIQGDISEYVVPLNKVNRIAAQIGSSIGS